jgi:hypothetical protein
MYNPTWARSRAASYKVPDWTLCIFPTAEIGLKMKMQNFTGASLPACLLRLAANRPSPRSTRLVREFSSGLSRVQIVGNGW